MSNDMILREINGIEALGFTTMVAIKAPDEPNNSLVGDPFDGGTYIIALVPNEPTFEKGLMHVKTGKPRADQFVMLEHYSLDEVVRLYKQQVKLLNNE